MPFWTRPWDVLQAYKGVQIVVVQNHNLLELGGEPCYLLQRKKVGETVTGAKTYPFEFDADNMRYYAQVWAPADGDGNFPDPRNFELQVDLGSGSETWTQRFDDDNLVLAEKEYYLIVSKDAMDEEGVASPDGVWVYLNTPPFTGGSGVRVSWTFTTICKCWDLHSYQPTLGNCPTCRSAEYGWDQYLNPNFTYRNRKYPHGFLLAFPNLTVDMHLFDRSFVQEASFSHWTSPPPLSPEVFEHDVIVVPGRGNMIMEIVDITYGRIDGLPVFQGFNVVEVEAGSPTYDITLVTT